MNNPIPKITTINGGCINIKESKTPHHGIEILILANSRPMVTTHSYDPKKEIA